MKSGRYFWGITLFFLGLASLPGQAAPTAQLNFSFTVSEPTCDVSANPSSIDWDESSPGGLMAEEIGLNSNNYVKSLQLTFSCGGVSVFGKQPALELTGTTLVAGDGNYTSGSYQYLFNNGGTGAANYVGFNVCVVSLKTDCGNGIDIYKPSQGDKSVVYLADKNQPTPSTVTVYVQPSTGRYSTPLVAGDLQADVTFTFNYQ